MKAADLAYAEELRHRADRCSNVAGTWDFCAIELPEGWPIGKPIPCGVKNAEVFC